MIYSSSYLNRLLLFLLVIISQVEVFSQTYDFEYFSLEEGLPQSEIYSILQDSRGYLWIGTRGGVCKFDGINFTEYSKKDGIAGDFITGITEDIDGNIWFISNWGGITQFNGLNFTIHSKEKGSSINKAVNSIFTDYSGKMWIGTELGAFTFSNRSFSKKVLNGPINFITEDSQNNIWIGTERGLTVINETDTILISPKNGLSTKHINTVLEDHEGNYLLGTSDQGVLKLITGESLKKEFYQFEKLIDNHANVSSIIEDSKKNVWISTIDNGIYQIDSLKNINRIHVSNGLKTDRINLLFKDRSNHIWIGTSGEGLAKTGNLAFSNFKNIEGLNQSITSITEDDQGNIWVSNAQGLFKYDGEKSVNYTIKDGLGSNTISHSFKDKDGVLWFATYGGLTRYKDNVFRNFTTADGLPNNLITHIIQTRDGNLLIGCNGGLIKYDYSSFTTVNTEENDLTSNLVLSLLEDSSGNIWIGTGNGINKYANGTFSNYLNSEGVCNSYIGSIVEDKYGNIWFGNDRCLMKYDGIDFTSMYAADENLTSDIIYLLHFNSKGDLWVGSNKGIDKITFNSYGHIDKIKNYNSTEGFKGLECNQNAIYEDLDGNLWIGTVKGCIKYTPSADIKITDESYMHIDNIKLSFESVNWSNYVKKLSPWNNLPEDLILDYDQNHLTFEFSAINLTHPERLSYSFKLDGFDDNWQQSTTKQSTTYSNLPPGDYSFMVKSTSKINENKIPSEFSFTITPPIWRTWWVYILFFILLSYLIHRITSYRAKKQLTISRELEVMVKERTSLIERQRDEKEILLKEIHHRVKNNMQVISSLLNIQSSYTEDQNALKLFDEAKRRIRAMALIHEKLYQSSDLVGIDFKDYIMVLVDDIITSYVINCEIKLDIKIDALRFNIDTLIPLGLILNEIISNSLKYAFIDKYEGDIKIHLTFNNKDNAYYLIIGDNGVGMIEDIGTTKKESLGVELIKIFVEQLDGSIERLKEPGTVYQIKFKQQD